jgi:hypothetical protein
MRGGVPGLSLALPAHAAVDVARRLGNLGDVRAVLCEAVQRGLATPEDLERELKDGPSAGSALPRRALADIAAGCRSPPECEVRDLVRASTMLPEPRWNQPLRGANDRSLIPDTCWPEARLIVEVDSIEWHRFGDRPEATGPARKIGGGGLARVTCFAPAVAGGTPTRVKGTGGCVAIRGTGARNPNVTLVPRLSCDTPSVIHSVRVVRPYRLHHGGKRDHLRGHRGCLGCVSRTVMGSPWRRPHVCRAQHRTHADPAAEPAPSGT